MKLQDGTYSTDGPQCPYCNREFVPDEGFYYDSNLAELDCDECGKAFKVEVYHSVSWTCFKKEV
jgi:transcription elongation factor Elf1